MKVVPVPTKVPPVKAEYQSIVPALAVALKLTVPVPHLEAGVVPVIVGVTPNSCNHLNSWGCSIPILLTSTK